MTNLTIAELKIFRNKKNEFLKLKYMLEGLKKYKLKSVEKSIESERLTIIDTCILDLRNEIRKLKGELEVEENDIVNTINTVWDDTAKKALMMHYVECICWDDIAKELGGWKDSSGARSMVHRGLKRVGKKYKNRGYGPNQDTNT